MRVFEPRDAFVNPSGKYHLLPFRFHRTDSQNELLVNECGEFLFAPTGTVKKIVRREPLQNAELYATLKAKHFIYDDYSSPLLDVLASKYRSKFEFINGSTKLHIFAVTLRCDHSCHYCQVSRQTVNKDQFDMSEETARASVDLMLQSPSDDLTLELQGGEPLLAFERIKFIVALAKEGAANLGKHLNIVITSNLSPLTDDILEFCATQKIKL